MSAVHWITTNDPLDSFPPVHRACSHPNGLLAAGGDLSVARLLIAYRKGIFPWFEDGQPVLWWSPDPRTVFEPQNLHRSRSLRRHIRRYPPRVSINTCFAQVMNACAEPRPGQAGTWITSSMKLAYTTLHQSGHAHSIEIWDDATLVGGLYGLSIGKVFFAESMFSHATNGSKIALSVLAKWLEKHNFALIDGQVKSPHLITMGGIEMPRERFVSILDAYCDQPTDTNMWQKNDKLDVEIV